MSTVKPPSRIDPLNFPVFGMSWYADPGSGKSILAYAGGGGSARTGVKNFIVIFKDGIEENRISTGDLTGFSVKIYNNPTTNKLWVVVSLGKIVNRYTLDGNGEYDATMTVVDPPEDPNDEEAKKVTCDCVAVNSMADRLACGLENGLIKVYEISDDKFDSDNLLFVCDNHTKGICCLDFAVKNSFLLSSGKDGTAKLWDNNGKGVANLICDCTDPRGPPPKRKQQILVRGCAFTDMVGKDLITVASPRRGAAFLSLWVLQRKNNKFRCMNHTRISENPISAISMSKDGTILAMGSVSGSIILWDTVKWSKIKEFKEVHQLPVTCLAVRPYSIALQEDFDNVSFNAISASADSQLAMLTTKRQPVQFGWWLSFIFSLLYNSGVLAFVVIYILLPIYGEYSAKCGNASHSITGIGGMSKCFYEELVWSPSWKPGVGSVPY